jgi:hypothetical protein
MKSKWPAYILSLIFLGISSFQKPHSLVKKWSLDIGEGTFTTDPVGNVYLLDKDFSIRKLDRNGKLLATANFKLYGELSQIDASNPFEVYLYYRQNQRIVIVDNLLSIRGEIDLNAISNVEVSAICRSYDNGIWVYDAGDGRLIKYDKQLERQLDSRAANTWTNKSWHPHELYENGKNVFILDRENGMVMFDIFGNYGSKLDMVEVDDIQLRNEKILFFSNGYLQSMDPLIQEVDTLIAWDAAKNIRWESKQLYVHENQLIQVLSVP